jgi:hypothetical protein
MSWLNELTQYFEISDKHVRKENKRRNIYLENNDIYKDILFNFTTTISFQHIQDIYQLDNNCLNKKNFNDDIVMTNGFEDLSTFQETFPLENMEMDYDDGLSLRRR